MIWSRLVTTVGLVGILAACSSSSDDGGPCVQRKGSFIAKYSQRSGTCGNSAETVLNIDKQPTSVDAPCTGSISYTADNCQVTYESACPNDGAVKGGRLSITGHSKWNSDGTSGTATEQWVLSDASGKTLCQSTYDVTVTKQ